MRGRVFFRTVPLLLGMALLTGCGENRTPSSPVAFEIEKEYRRGPVVFRVKVEKGEIALTDRLRLLLQVQAKEEEEIKLPAFGDKLDDFAIVDYTSPPPRLIAPGEILLERSYLLEPFLSGDYVISPMTVVFQKKGSQEKHEIASEPISIRVKSVLSTDGKDLAIRDIAPEIEVPRRLSPWIYGLAIAGWILLLAGIGYYYWVRKRTPIPLPPHPTPKEIAARELAQLLAEDLPRRGAYKLFYERLSGILRHYIENQFGLHAPERTTEEFLEELRTSDVLAANHKILLRDFLRHCDLVKFAAHEPTTSEIEGAIGACRRFLEESKPRHAI